MKDWFVAVKQVYLVIGKKIKYLALKGRRTHGSLKANVNNLRKKDILKHGGVQTLEEKKGWKR